MGIWKMNNRGASTTVSREMTLKHREGEDKAWIDDSEAAYKRI
jgi:hypothetical protein